MPSNKFYVIIVILSFILETLFKDLRIFKTFGYLSGVGDLGIPFNSFTEMLFVVNKRMFCNVTSTLWE